MEQLEHKLTQDPGACEWRISQLSRAAGPSLVFLVPPDNYLESFHTLPKWPKSEWILKTVYEIHEIHCLYKKNKGEKMFETTAFLIKSACVSLCSVSNSNFLLILMLRVSQR